MRALFHLPRILLLATSLHAAPVINEIHYNNDDNTVLNEFVEIHNPDPDSIDLAGWELNGAVRFTFPAGSVIPSGGFLVIAEDPATIFTEFGVQALGPYQGGLNSEGELLQLLDPTGAEIDRVDYGVGFPWPSRAKGEGSSMELINPFLDNDLGSSWRSSGIGATAPAQVFIPAGSTWSFRKGTNEASSPIHAWTSLNFVEDASWSSDLAPFGRNEPAFVETNLSDALGNYSSVFLRKKFTVNSLPPSTVILKILYDDGVIVWLNGSEIYRSDSVAPGIIDFRGNDPTNAGGDGTAIASDEQDGYEEYAITGIDHLFEAGENVLSIQVFNDSLASSDILIDASLETPEPFSDPAPPSPGLANGTVTAFPPPNIRQVQHFPEQPTSSDPVTISAKVSDADGVASVTLSYQVVTPGSYIRLTDAAYESTWTDLAMLDPEGDDTYSAIIPAQGHRHLIRYRISVSDTLGVKVRTPFEDDEQPNFAYFIYDGIPTWTGANRPGSDAPIAFQSSLLESLPTYHLLANSTDVTNSQYNSSFQNTRFLGTLVYDGVVYDHVEYTVRGEFSTYQSGKNKWRFFFKPAREFEARDNYGQKYREPWDELTMNANASPWAAVNRGMSGLDEALSYRAFQVAGMASPNTNYLHFRVIDDAQEASPSDQYSGDLWGLYLAVEQPDGSFLDERDLPDGNVYKIEGGGNGDKKHQAPNQPLTNTDWVTFNSQSGSVNTEAWWRENLDLESYFTFRALNRALGNVDIRDGWNHYFYHRSNPDGSPGPWVPVPWDLDMMYICLRHQGGTIRQRNSLQIPALNIEFKNRCREVLDLMLADPDPNGGQIGQLINEFSKIVNPTGQANTWADLDRHMWNYHPRTRSSGSAQTNHRGNFHTTPYTDSRFGGSWVRTLDSANFEGSQNYILNYMTDTDPAPQTWFENSGDQRGYGFNFLTSEALDTNIPNTPALIYTGDPAFSTTGLSFESSAFADPQGNGTFRAMEWRVAEIANPIDQPPLYEMQESWSSGVLTAFEAGITLPALATRPDRTYRVRVRHQDTTGRWSHWSAPFEFQTTTPDLQVYQQNLVISEMMYNPAGDDSVEFIELFNQGTTPLDLTNVRFTKGVDYDFPAGTILGAGAYLVVVKNTLAFEAKYGTNLPLAPGQYDEDSLSNAGETLKLSLGTIAIHEFDFDDDFPWPTTPDGNGFSLVLAQTSDHSANHPLDPLGHGIATNWRASSGIDGSPGLSDPTDLFSGDPDLDLDFDGLSALLEHAFGTSISESNPTPLSITLSGDQASLTFPVNPLADDVTYLVETTSDLENWSLLDNLSGRTATSRTYTTNLIIPVDKLFFRVRVQQTTAVPRPD